MVEDNNHLKKATFLFQFTQNHDLRILHGVLNKNLFPTRITKLMEFVGFSGSRVKNFSTQLTFVKLKKKKLTVTSSGVCNRRCTTIFVIDVVQPFAHLVVCCDGLAQELHKRVFKNNSYFFHAVSSGE